MAIGESAHHVREFYLLRHRLLRFLVERCEFSVYAFETPVLESHTMDAWVRGGPGTVDDVAATTGTGLARCREMYRTLTWMRAHNRRAARPLRFAGVLAGIGGGSPVGELSEVASYLRHDDPDALPLPPQRAHSQNPVRSRGTNGSVPRRVSPGRSPRRRLHRHRRHAIAHLPHTSTTEYVTDQS